MPSVEKVRNPHIDFGFHAVVPRVIRTGYHDITPIQKWLYVCLKDLCGDDSVCYRTLLALKEETGISTGMISESIPALHQAGLIHAEKKKRRTGGKEVWHITIVDIWQANAKAHPTKRSHSEQTLSVADTDVHSVNQNVHSVNEKGRERSLCERERSLCESAQSCERASQLASDTQKEAVSNNNEAITITEVITGKESDDAVASPRPRKKPSQKYSSPELTPEQLAIYETFDHLRGTKEIRSRANTAAIDELLSVGADSASVSAVYQELMKDSWWKDKLTIPAFTRQYPTKLTVVKIKQNGNGHHALTSRDASAEEIMEARRQNWQSRNTRRRKNGLPEQTFEDYQTEIEQNSTQKG